MAGGIEIKRSESKNTYYQWNGRKMAWSSGATGDSNQELEGSEDAELETGRARGRAACYGLKALASAGVIEIVPLPEPASSRRRSSWLADHRLPSLPRSFFRPALATAVDGRGDAAVSWLRRSATRGSCAPPLQPRPRSLAAAGVSIAVRGAGRAGVACGTPGRSLLPLTCSLA